MHQAALDEEWREGGRLEEGELMLTDATDAETPGEAVVQGKNYGSGC